MMVSGLVLLLKIFPEDNAHGDHAEAKQKILQRDGADAHPHKKLRIIHHDMAREITIHQELKADNHGKKYVI